MNHDLTLSEAIGVCVCVCTFIYINIYTHKDMPGIVSSYLIKIGQNNEGRMATIAHAHNRRVLFFFYFHPPFLLSIAWEMH